MTKSEVIKKLNKIQEYLEELNVFKKELNRIYTRLNDEMEDFPLDADEITNEE